MKKKDKIEPNKDFKKLYLEKSKININKNKNIVNMFIFWKLFSFLYILTKILMVRLPKKINNKPKTKTTNPDIKLSNFPPPYFKYYITNYLKLYKLYVFHPYCE